MCGLFGCNIYYYGQIYFRWISPLFRLGKTKTLDEEDLYDINPTDQTQNLAESLHE